ncbi:MAG: inositol monophosphatase family protein [Gammaproteobacteria bacterium]
MHPHLNIAVKAARLAGRILMRFYDSPERLQTREKGFHDLVTIADGKAEEAIIDTIKTAYPKHHILAEEQGSLESNVDSDYLWIIDPLDGTFNYAHGYPSFCVSIALQFKNYVDIAVIYDPISQDLFTAVKGQGAQLNGKRIRVSKATNFQHGLIGACLPYRNIKRMPEYCRHIQALVEQGCNVRWSGSAALNLAAVAAGRLDGFWAHALEKWDIAAGILLIKEAGGIVSGVSDELDPMETGRICASTPKLMPLLQGVLNQ